MPNRGYKQTISHRAKISKNHGRFVFEDASYGTKHLWINRKNGKASRCENRIRGILDFDCRKISDKYQWAKRKGHPYSRDRDDYYQLCVSCHKRYDYTATKNKVLIKLNNMKKKLPKVGDEIHFHISNPNWANPLSMKGIVKESSKLFGGHICIEEGAVTQEEVLIRLSSVK